MDIEKGRLGVPMPTEDKMITIRLPENDIGQIIDGLCVRQNEWRYTQRYFEEGYQESGRIIEECRDAEEARKIADYYEEIISELRTQLNNERGTSP